MPLLECIPNVSDGRRPAVLQRLAEAVQVPGAALLDLSSDPDHHRSVLTLAGEPEPLHRALLALYERAIEEIDLRRHKGAHPRIGAVDVTPFVPLAGASMDQAQAAARRLGEAVGERFSLPVFLYGQGGGANLRLADLRRGGLPGLAARMADAGQALRPDWGPGRLHTTAGATAVGARFFLIAVNAVLEERDLAAARAIARSVRASSGGLPAVQALGLDLPSRHHTQVSMNLLDFRQTSLDTLLQAVAAQAEARGHRIAEVEVVGLLPQAAMEPGPGEESDTYWRPFVRDDQILETRLRAAGLAP